MTRLNWDEYFMKIVDAVSGRSTCDRGRSGSVIVKGRRILTTGYGGAPTGLPHCDDVGHEMKDVMHEDGSISKHCVRTTHAEMNAILQAAKYGTSIDEATIYCSMEPCYNCAKAIINSGIKKVVARKKYHEAEDSRRIFKEAGLELVVINDEMEIYDEM